MPLVLASFVCGLIFSAGLLISGMTQTGKVLGFLDIFGAWDATLAFVMAGAVAISSIGFALAKRRGTPILAAQSLWPTRRDIDAHLVVGAALFGVGWGLVGLCPGPALVNLVGLSLPVIVFVAAMAAGMLGFEAWDKRKLSGVSTEQTTVATVDG
ncbi:putative membrane protein YedE/YeeE [Nitrobacteraceae bacterium AZCC 1564]